MKKIFFIFFMIFTVIFDTQHAISLPSEVPWQAKAASLVNDLDWEFEKMPGALKDISVGNKNLIWGIQRDGTVVSWDIINEKWTPIPNDLKLEKVCVAIDGTVWGITPANVTPKKRIRRWISKTKKWQVVDGGIQQISVGNKQNKNVWAINLQGKVFNNPRYRRRRWTWSKVPGKLKQLSVGIDGYVWGINTSNIIYQWNKGKKAWDLVDNYTWNKATKTWELNKDFRLNQLSVKGRWNLWGVDPTGTVYSMTSMKKQWYHIANNFRQVSIDPLSNAWGIGMDGNTYKITKNNFGRTLFKLRKKDFSSKLNFYKKNINTILKNSHNKNLFMPYLNELIENRKKEQLTQLTMVIQSLINHLDYLIGSFGYSLTKGKMRTDYTTIAKNELSALNDELVKKKDIASKPISLAEAFKTVKDQFEPSAKNPTETPWINDEWQKTLWLNKVEYLVQIITVELPPGLDELFDNLKINLDVNIAWREKFTEKQRSNLTKLVEEGLTKIKEEKQKMGSKVIEPVQTITPEISKPPIVIAPTPLIKPPVKEKPIVITPETIQLEKGIPTPDQLTTLLDQAKTTFDDETLHKSPEEKTKWLNGFEVLGLTKKMMSQQQLTNFDTLTKTVEKAITTPWRKKKWIDPFNEQQQESLTKLIEQSKKTLTYDELFEYLDTTMKTIDPTILLNSFEQLYNHPDAKDREDQHTWIIEEIQAQAEIKFTDKEKQRLNEILKKKPPTPAVKEEDVEKKDVEEKVAKVAEEKADEEKVEEKVDGEGVEEKVVEGEAEKKVEEAKPAPKPKAVRAAPRRGGGRRDTTTSTVRGGIRR